MAMITPTLKAKGIYTLAVPFPDLSGKVYQCTAIRSFSDYLDLGESIFDQVYAPVGLSQAAYDADLAAKANIVTLTSEEGPSVLVPDSYIVKYPDLEYVPYSQIVISAALGALPDNLSLLLLQEQVAGVISDVIGVTPVVQIHTTESTGVVTLQAHTLMEQTRQAAITNRTSDRARVVELKNKTVLLEQKIKDLEQLILNG